jgi:hypothetical protein
MASDPNAPDGIDPEGRAVPPYDDRRSAADVSGAEQATRDEALVGGATGPVEYEKSKAQDPADTPGGATGSPADEQPAAQAPQTDLDDDRVGPAHTTGTGRGEDQA